MGCKQERINETGEENESTGRVDGDIMQGRGTAEADEPNQLRRRCTWIASGACWTEARNESRIGRPRGPPRPSVLSIRGTVSHRSSARQRHPTKIRQGSVSARAGCTAFDDHDDGKVRLTSSGVTGLCDVFLSSSIVFGSRRRSFLQPTRRTGRPAQK